MKTILQSAALFSLACAGAQAQVTLPNECEAVAARLAPISSTLGDGASFGADISDKLVYTNKSLRCWANFPFIAWPAAEFTVGSKIIARPALTTPALPQVFSTAVLVPDLGGKQLVLRIAIGEDDNDDGIIDGSSDDQWETTVALDRPGPAMINVPLSSFRDMNPRAGTDAQEFATVKRISLLLTFQTRASLPGGLVQGPVSIGLDHIGIFDAPQQFPQTCRADFDGAGGVGPSDILAFLTAWFAGDARADFDASGVVGVPDIFAFLGAWFAGCAG